MSMPEDAHELLREAVHLERAGQFDRALDYLSAAAEAGDAAVVAESFRHRADIHRTRCEWEPAFEYARRSADAARAAGLSELQAEAVNAEAAVHMSRRSYGEADALLGRVLELTEDPRIRGIALQNLGVIAAEEARLAEAGARFESSRACFDAAGYDRGMALALVNAGRVALLEEDNARAELLCGEGERIARREGDLEIAAMASFNLAEALIRTGRIEEAEEPASIALGYFTGVGNDWRRVDCLRLFGDLHRRAGDLATARQCYERGLEIARQADTPLDVTRLNGLLAELDPPPGDLARSSHPGAPPSG